VKISISPRNLTPGTRAKLTCDSSSSNPPAKVSWWKDGISVHGVNPTTTPGLWGGAVSSLDTYINVTKDLNGIVYTCQSINEELQRSVHEIVTLNILCKFVYSLELFRKLSISLILSRSTKNSFGISYVFGC